MALHRRSTFLLDTHTYSTLTGQDATEAFEDVGHSDEARALLPDLLVGNFEGGVRYRHLSFPISPILT